MLIAGNRSRMMEASEGKEIPKEKSEAIMVDLVGDNSKESTGDEDLTKVGMDETALNEERPPPAVTEALKRRSSVGHSIRRSQSGTYHQVWSLNQFHSDDSLNNQGSV